MVSLRWWRRGVSMSTEAARPWLTVTAPLGMWGQQARQARLLPLIFICSTVCFAFKSLAEREALDTPWMAQDHGPLFKDPGSFFKAKGIQDEEGWCLKAKVWSWMGQRVSRQHRLALMKRGALCNNTWSSWRTMLGGWVRGKVTRVHLDGLSRWNPGWGKCGIKTNTHSTSQSNLAIQLLHIIPLYQHLMTVTCSMWLENWLGSIPQAGTVHWQGGISAFKKQIYIYLLEQLYCTFLLDTTVTTIQSEG